MMLPYAGISEPIRVYYDGPNNRSRTEYYHGQDVMIYRPDMFQFGTEFVIIPETYDAVLNIRSCVQLNGSSDSTTSLQSIIPDMSLFQLAGHASRLGIDCQDWVYNYTDMGRTNVHHFYISVATKAPVQLHMMGYDFLLGSHYDEYVLNFLTWTPGPIANSSVFDAPDMTCGNFPGPGSMATSRGALGLLEDAAGEESETQAQFTAFAAAHGKTYGSPQEQRTRLHNFRNNLRYINSMNRRHMSYSLAVNHLADLHESELRAMRGSVSSPRAAAPKYVSKPGRPDSLDWRTSGAVSPVKDQGICGSCWSFATAQTIESALFLKT